MLKQKINNIKIVKSTNIISTLSAKKYLSDFHTKSTFATHTIIYYVSWPKKISRWESRNTQLHAYNLQAKNIILLYLPAPHKPVGLLPECIESFFMRCTILSAVIETSCVLVPNWSRFANLIMYKHGSVNEKEEFLVSQVSGLNLLFFYFFFLIFSLTRNFIGQGDANRKQNYH